MKFVYCLIKLLLVGCQTSYTLAFLSGRNGPQPGERIQPPFSHYRPTPKWGRHVASVQSNVEHSNAAHDDDSKEEREYFQAKQRRLSHLLDQALLLHLKCQNADTSQKISCEWMIPQISSLVDFLAHRFTLTRTVTSLQETFNDRTTATGTTRPTQSLFAWSRQLAWDIEQSMLQRAPLTEIDAQLLQFRQLQEAIQTAELLRLHDHHMEYTVQSQLDSFTELMDELLQTTAATTTARKPLSSMAATFTPVDTNAKVSDGQSSQRLEAESVSSDEILPATLYSSESFVASEPPSLSTEDSVTAEVTGQNAPLDATQENDDIDSDLDESSLAVLPDYYHELGGDNEDDHDEVDIAIVGSGLAGLCAGALLNTLYGKRVGVYESHYLAGGCAHAFERRIKGSKDNTTTFTFDSGPSILLGCSSPPYNALRQVLNAIDQEVEWIPYDGWGMIERPGTSEEVRWRVELGPDRFENGPLKKFGGESALDEFRALQQATKGLLAGASIPALAMRPGPSALFPLLRYFTTLVSLVSQGETITGTFAPFMDGPIFKVTDPWLYAWLDALAFSLSGLPARRTAAAAMAFVLSDMHRPGASLDYPKGGMGKIVDALVRGVEQGDNGSKVYLRQHVTSIDASDDASRITGITLKNGRQIKARDGVICNAPVWSIRNLIQDKRVLERLNNNLPLDPSPTPPSSWSVTRQGSFKLRTRDVPSSKGIDSVLSRCDTAEQTGSFLHLHIALDSTDLDLDSLEAHYTVMDRGIGGRERGDSDVPCGELNMIAVSNPCVLDRNLAPEGYIVVHAYGAGNEPYEIWQNFDRRSTEYERLKEERAKVLWRAVESVIPDVRDRAVFHMVGSPLTHERFLRRIKGTYGSATEDYLKDGSTPFSTLVIANDGVFPGIGVPSVCIAGASAANAFVSTFRQWQCLDELKRRGKH